ncbi:Alpha tocopherol transfer protein [Operophtera brumata]|uniref:Alpha tocopherol transfer protein n=1 Tax=Operophtera brumata TaxID=104452 RepID=A0A0L7KPT3_OPEBR|nr:Alpha tocopherol transfer protein [Operophtera brumata]
MFDQHPFYPVTEEDKKLIRAELDRKIVENLLIIAKGSIEKTKGRIDNLYKYRSYAPELIQNREKILNSSDDIWNPYIQLPMPRLYNGNRITMRYLGGGHEEYHIQPYAQNESYHHAKDFSDIPSHCDLHEAILQREDHGPTDKYEKEIRSTKTKTLLIESSKLISNESRRPNAEKNEDYIVGSFRKLDFD